MYDIVHFKISVDRDVQNKKCSKRSWSIYNTKVLNIFYYAALCRSMLSHFKFD